MKKNGVQKRCVDATQRNEGKKDFLTRTLCTQCFNIAPPRGGKTKSAIHHMRVFKSLYSIHFEKIFFYNICGEYMLISSSV